MSQLRKDEGILQNYGKQLKVSFTDKGTRRVKQASKDECDINIIMEKYRTHGTLPINAKPMGKFGDFSGVSDYHSALTKVVEYQESFDLLPAHLRAKFRNDPSLLIEYLNEPKNIAEAVKLGIITKDALKAPEDTSSESPKATKGKASTKSEKPSTSQPDAAKGASND